MGSFEITGIDHDNYNRYQFLGLSSDLDKLPHDVSSGSVAQCADTGDKYVFLKGLDTWYKQPSGKDGEPGKDGKNGVSITTVSINENKHLICGMSDGNEIDAGEVPAGKDGIDGKDGQPGTNGKDGISVQSASIDEYDHLQLHMSNETEIDAGELPKAEITVDEELTDDGVNPVQGKVIKNYIDEKTAQAAE